MRYLLLVVAGCGFSARSAATDDAPHAVDGTVPHDAPGDASAIDAPKVEPYMLACTAGTLYGIDIVSQNTTMLGPIAGGGTTFSMFALAGNSSILYGIPSTDDKLLQIDPATGTVLQARAITQHDFYGLAYAAAGELGAEGAWFAGTDNMGETANVAHLYTINPATGAETVVGPFGAGLSIAGDLAYVHSRGLYGTFYGPGCNPTCIASVNPTTGTAIVLTFTGPANVLSLSGFRGRLWGLSNAGLVYEFDPATGATLQSFDTGLAWADAAN
ncbi:MAG: hypothetical protein JO257_22815 [Deltaproteobacteria bacterium]|nr:hypothetical protein [Deltaproteobacteria bacterium]